MDKLVKLGFRPYKSDSKLHPLRSYIIRICACIIKRFVIKTKKMEKIMKYVYMERHTQILVINKVNSKEK
jgi:hypothetical protein